ncbi:helix-turn-helix protein [compost metagenome]
MTQNVFELFTDDKEESAILGIKSKLVMLIVQNIRNNEWTQAQVAEMVGITQPRVSNLMQGQLSKFSVDTLITINMKLGSTLSVDIQPNSGINIEMYLPGVNSTLCKFAPFEAIS